MNYLLLPESSLRKSHKACVLVP